MTITPRTPDPAWRLLALELTLRSSTEHFYANGRQQVALLLYIEATLDPADVHDPTLVPLTTSEIASLQLVTYEMEEPVPWDAGATAPGWSASRLPAGYDPYPSTQADAGRPLGQHRVGGQYFELFLSGLQDNVQVRPGELRKFAIGLRGDNGKRYLSNNKYWDAEGNQQSTGGFETNVSVIPVAPVRYAVESFSLGRVQLAQQAEAALLGDESLPPESEFVFVLTLRGNDGRPIGLKSLSSTPEGTVRWLLPPGSTTSGCYTGYASPHEEVFRWNPNVGIGSRPAPAYPMAHAGKALLALVGRVDLTPGSSPGACALTVIDDFGNAQRLSVDFADRTSVEGRWTLALGN